MESQEILKAVNDFYQQAWDKLLVYTGVLVALVGIIIPILSTWSQRIREKAIKKELINSLDSKYEALEKKLEAIIEKNFAEKSRSIDESITVKIAGVQALTFHIQARNFSISGDFKQALTDYCIAGTGFLESNDLLNVQRVNANMLITIQEISKEDLIALQEEKAEPDTYISLMSKYNRNGLFTDAITNIKREIGKIVKTEDKSKTIKKLSN